MSLIDDPGLAVQFFDKTNYSKLFSYSGVLVLINQQFFEFLK